MAALLEVNFDGLVGPSHNYAGLSSGNLASAKHQYQVSNPRAAALQGLDKMALLMRLGLTQGYLPPLARPDFAALHDWGFTGKPADVLEKAYQQAPHLLAAAWSASSMWVANAATVTPSCDSSNGKVNFTPANLLSMPHRAIDAEHTGQVLKQVFANRTKFQHWPPLSGGSQFADEGAANHCRFINAAGVGVHLFVHGGGKQARSALKFPARQGLDASEAVARRHGIDSKSAVYAQQSVEAINSGAFHNDVVAVSHESTLLYHEQAFEHTEQVLAQLSAAVGDAFEAVCVPKSTMGLTAAIRSYLFNSQLITVEGGLALVAPDDVLDMPEAKQAIEVIIAGDNRIVAIHTPKLRESMKNGGGPACLRLRVSLSAEELGAVEPKYLLNETRLSGLQSWVETNYRDQVHFDDLRDLAFADEVRALTQTFHTLEFD